MKYLVSTFLTLISLNLYAQVSLLKDINDQPASILDDNHYGNIFFECNGFLFFSIDGALGRELWRTDGTAEGTFQIQDLNQGSGDGISGSFSCLQDQLYFLGFEGSEGFPSTWDLWQTDGTSEGTHKKFTLNSSLNSPITTVGDKIFGAKLGEDKSLELWSSDGTESGTVSFATINDDGSFSNLYDVTSSETHVFYQIGTNSGSDFIFQLWASDGTESGTMKIFESDFYSGNMLGIGSKLFFDTSDELGGELWITDGTIYGTGMIEDLGWKYASTFFSYKNMLLFEAGQNLWRSDGTEDGTYYLFGDGVNAGVVLDDIFYGVGTDYSAGENYLLSTDGERGGTSRIIDLGGSFGDISMYGTIPTIDDKFFLPVYTEDTGAELGISDGTQEGTELVKDILVGATSSLPKSWATLNDKVIFIANDGTHGAEIWITDGTESGTYLLKNTLPGTQDFRSYGDVNIKPLDGKLYFHGDDFIYQSDGTLEGTNSVADSEGSYNLLGGTDEYLLYLYSRKFYALNSSGLSLVKDISEVVSGYGIETDAGLANDGILYFPFNISYGDLLVGNELWVTDGTEAGTNLVKDINSGSANGIDQFGGGFLENQFIFSANDGNSGNELWITNGTESGTTLLKDINSGEQSSNPSNFVTLGNEVFFAANDGENGYELWKTDGTEAGTLMVSNFSESTQELTVKRLVKFSNNVYFSAYNDENGWALWKSNGSTEGTVLVKDVNVDTVDPTIDITNLTVIGDKIYFSMDDGTHGNELWVSDGSEEGTILIDVLEGQVSSNPSLFTEVQGFLYFKSNNQLWRTDGTVDQTSMIADYEPLEILYFDDWIYFTSPTNEYGIEVFKVPFSSFDQSVFFEPITVKTIGEESFSLSAQATSGLNVDFTTNNGNINIENGSVNMLSPGTVTIYADQAGNEFYNSAGQVEQTFCINPSKPLITLVESKDDYIVLSSSSDSGNQWYLDGNLLDEAQENSFKAYESGVYTLRVTVDTCESEWSDEAAIVITNSESNPANGVKFYPNPANDVLNIQVKQSSETVKIRIINVNGKIMDEFSVTQNIQLAHPLNDYPKGLYLINISSSSGNDQFHKFVKE